MSTSGAQLLPQDAVSSLREVLLPLATIITPNIPEAKLLLGRQDQSGPQTREETIQLAKDLHALGCKYVLVKGGHFGQQTQESEKKQSIIDVLYDGNRVSLIEKEYIDSKNTHGTGCSLACTQVPPLLMKRDGLLYLQRRSLRI